MWNRQGLSSNTLLEEKTFWPLSRDQVCNLWPMNILISLVVHCVNGLIIFNESLTDDLCIN